MPIADGEHRQLLALHEFFDQNLTAGVAEDSIPQHGIDRALGLSRALRNDHTLSAGETRRLDHNWRGEISKCRLCRTRISVLAGARSRNSGLHHQILRE